ncbi:hypothetical protein AUR64_03620 [Haloprofundus marisrubri]|uniref:Uncharacterized protein n=1 Tax=Haloprofundus marisrubri TaxID=1514971 RepID=A0A0W1RD57_9EURY|nr:hypothetical protein [Haloprofundus marisrubri]KTG11357.1 hypothetical protein AUR64_03620 [Haloprofundus marisrubri]
MLRTILSAVCIAELLAPKGLIRAAEKLALNNPGACEYKSWVVPGARMEGLLLLFFMWRSDTSYSAFKEFLGVVGILAFLFPRAYVDYGSELAYADASSCEWRPWVYTGTRIVGLLYIGVAVRELLRK